VRAPDEAWWWEIWQGGKRVDTRHALLYSRLFLPRNTLEALYLRRISPTRVLKVSAVSDVSLPNGGTILGLVQNDHGKFSTEYLYSTDSALLGVRGLYNFGPDLQKEDVVTLNPSDTPEEMYSTPLIPSAGLFSAGAELYYGLLNKSGGLSTGLRFTTLPSHTSFPYTMTLTLNPLMGNLSSTYSVKAGPHLAFSSRFDFNFYSYESGVLVGLELWRMRRPNGGKDVEWARKKLIQEPWEKPSGDKFSSDLTDTSLDALSFSRTRIKEDEDVAGVLKARIDQNWRIGLLWEGRFKELLFSVGTSIDLKRKDQIFRGLGLEVQYSS
jgi:mitochondrial distribution and morphology protein 10